MKNAWIDKWWQEEWTAIEGLSAMYDLEHGWLILDLSAADRLPKSLWNKLVHFQGFRWWRGHQWLVAKWSPVAEDMLETYLDAGEIEIIQLVDEGKADKYGEFAENAVRRADRAYEASERAVGGIPLGQPILVGHHSQKRHQAAVNRSHRAMERSFKERKKAAYWEARAAGSERWAAMKQNPGVIKRRIERLEADLRRAKRDLTKAQAGNLTATMVHYQRIAAHLQERIEYEQARYLRCGGAELDAEIEAKRDQFAPGAIVLNRFGDIRQVVRVSKKTITLTSLPFSRMIFWDEQVKEECFADYPLVAPPDATEVEWQGVVHPLPYRTQEIVPGNWVFVNGAWKQVTKVAKKTLTVMTAGGGAFKAKERRVAKAAVTGLLSAEEYEGFSSAQ